MKQAVTRSRFVARERTSSEVLYSCGKSGVDGIFGADTLAAVKAFQRDQGLNADGIVGAATWAALENPQSIQLYTVTIPRLPLYKAEAITGQYTGATMRKE